MFRLAFTVVFLATEILPGISQQTVFNSEGHTNSQWTTFPHPITRVAVIGAGPAGLQAAAHLLEANLTVRLFERAPSPGGNWFYTEETPIREAYPETNPQSPEDLPASYPATRYYEEGEGGIALEERWRGHWHPRPVWYTLHTNSPAAMTRLPGVQHPPDTPWRLSVHNVERHVRAYASLHGLNSNDKPSSPPYSPIAAYATRVEAMQKCNETATWTLTLRRLEWLPESKRLKATYWTENFDAVVIATGHYTTPYVPSIKGIGNWSAAIEDGRHSIYHSQSFRHEERYAGRTILIVGASVSSTEIARTIAPFTNRLIASVQPNKNRDARGFDILFGFPEKSEVVPEISSFEPLRAGDTGIKKGKIVLNNGTVIEGVDEVIFATGYRPTHLGGPGTIDSLHWTGHYIHDPTLAYAFTGRTWSHGPYQSLAFAKVWTGKARLPSREQMWQDHQSKKYQFGSPLDVLPQEALTRQWVAWLNSESLEFGGKFVEPSPAETREVLVYYFNTHWRHDLFSHENFTWLDNLPRSEWPTAQKNGLDGQELAW
ncbi:FAD/NAD-P-binding domain-containing protein [Mycena metata]|uniref:FAD/NAD-P-binding domain-containing protein n=1 Tax=Mycena metata TaxID=1033252 RepID=A0AAD7JKY2_9AGAR|nr:FAD/NAD-P-binding domain-containing protein [Mycena metata]